jgi:hypothetical protein
VAPPAEEVETMAAEGELSDYPAYPDYYYGGEGTYPPDYYEDLAVTSQPDDTNQTTFVELQQEESFDEIQAQPATEPSNNIHPGNTLFQNSSENSIPTY